LRLQVKAFYFYIDFWWKMPYDLVSKFTTSYFCRSYAMKYIALIVILSVFAPCFSAIHTGLAGGDARDFFYMTIFSLLIGPGCVVAYQISWRLFLIATFLLGLPIVMHWSALCLESYQKISFAKTLLHYRYFPINILGLFLLGVFMYWDYYNEQQQEKKREIRKKKRRSA
jgi:hypothetical protein